MDTKPEEQTVAKHKTAPIAFGSLTPRNIKQLRVLNSTVLPVQYGNKFYDQVLQHCELTQWAFYNDIFVGAISLRLDHVPEGQKLYIMTLGVLEPYRRLGVASKLLDWGVEFAKTKPQVTELYLHVQTVNEVAIKFYQKHGFQIVSTDATYYSKIEEKAAHLLSKKVK